MDVYSNVLYVQINQPELAQLAHKAIEVDKYRVETCCIIGCFFFFFIEKYSKNINIRFFVFVGYRKLLWLKRAT